MRCIECKLEIPQGARFCPHCGTSTNGMANRLQTNTPTQVSGSQPATSKRSYKVPSGEPVLTFHNKSTGVTFKMIKVEGGTFYMGLTPKEAQKLMDEGVDWRKKFPLVTLNSYYIGETVVTQALWKAVMNKSSVTQAYWQSSLGDLNNPSRFKGDNLPVENVSWNNCQEFITRLNDLLGFRFRLPTEAEWEFAAKGGNKSKGYELAGGNSWEDVAWVTLMKEERPAYLSTTKPVKTKRSNELGLFDMYGNVWEWCQDWYGDLNGGDYLNPQGPQSGSWKVLRGLSAFCYDEPVQSWRNSISPSLRNPGLTDQGQEIEGWGYDAFGFRLALSFE